MHKLLGPNAHRTFIFTVLILVGCSLSTTPPPQQHTSEIHTINLEIAQVEQPISQETPIAEATPEATPQIIGPENYPASVNPLTGLPVSDESILNRRPMVVKISNYPPLVRPQAGIGAADLVFEHYTEGGITRFSAIFYSQAPERVGSIRSARLIDYELVPMYQGLLVFSGASIGVEKRIYGSEDVALRIPGSEEVAPLGDIPPSEFADRAYKGVLYGRPYFWRDETIEIPHNMFANTAAIWELAAQEGHAQRPNLVGMAFSEQPPENPSGSGVLVDVRYRTTRVRWEYDATSGRYYRWVDGEPHRDANTGEQVSAANVIIVYTGHYFTDIIESVWQDSVSYSVQITVWPEGDAIVFRDGLRYEGRWLRPTRPDLMRFETNDGQILYLKPGNSWIQLVPLPEQMIEGEEWVRYE